jgi:hypothetical protein
MKKLIINLGVILMASTVLTSCGGSVESDAKKVAELTCKGGKGDVDALTEATALGTEMAKKYAGSEDLIKYTEALVKEAANCK